MEYVARGIVVCLSPKKLQGGDGSVPGFLFEDNQSTIVIAKAGYSPQLRHLAKRHRISLGLVHDFIMHPDIDIQPIESEKHKGDLLTKGFTKAKHEEALRMIGLKSLLGGMAFVLNSLVV